MSEDLTPVEKVENPCQTFYLYSSSGDVHRCYLKSEADKVFARHKRKRCLAKAEEWRSYASFCGIQSSWHNNRGFGKTAETWTWKECHAWKCVKRWRALAEEPTWYKFLKLIRKDAKV